MKHLLRNGPDLHSADDLVDAAWLIRNGYASGRIQGDYTKITDVPLNLIWEGVTDKGHKFLSHSVLKEKFLVPISVAVIASLLVTVIVGVFG